MPKAAKEHDPGENNITVPRNTCEGHRQHTVRTRLAHRYTEADVQAWTCTRASALQRLPLKFLRHGLIHSSRKLTYPVLLQGTTGELSMVDVKNIKGQRTHSLHHYRMLPRALPVMYLVQP